MVDARLEFPILEGRQLHIHWGDSEWSFSKKANINDLNTYSPNGSNTEKMGFNY